MELTSSMHTCDEDNIAAQNLYCEWAMQFKLFKIIARHLRGQYAVITIIDLSYT